MLSAAQPQDFSLSLSPEEMAEFRVSHIKEQFGLFNTVCDKAVPVVLSTADGTQFRTKLWAVDGDTPQLHFYVSGHGPQVASVLDAPQVTGIAYLESIKLQFDLTGLSLVRMDDNWMLQCGQPQEMYRIQRRNAYRVRASTRTEPYAKLRHPSMPDMGLRLHMLDVSIGGCALWLPNDVPPLQAGTLLGQLTVDLDADSSFTAAARLQHVSGEQSYDFGPGQGRKMGCAWHPLPGPAERVLQRWIDRAQQRARMLRQQ
jgi:flagellar brake protein